MPLSHAQIQKVVEILTTARMDQQVKLRFGFRKRDKLAAVLKAGTTPDNDYRYVWLKETRDALLDTLRARRDKFNVAHVHDAISLQDYVDALNSALLVIRTELAAD